MINARYTAINMHKSLCITQTQSHRAYVSRPVSNYRGRDVWATNHLGDRRLGDHGWATQRWSDRHLGDILGEKMVGHHIYRIYIIYIFTHHLYSL